MEPRDVNKKPSNPMKLSDFKTIHFIGIGGIGMSGLARLFLHEGKRVSGSDRAPSEITRALTAEGATIFEGHASENVHEGVELVVYTEAVNEKTRGYVELVAAREKGTPTMNYFEALGMVANEFYLIAVAGSHGKTTTTAMLIDIFEASGFDPSAIVGSLRTKTRSNYRAGKSKYFIVEACEYKRDFLSLTPDVLVITNIEYEHVDYYPDLRSVQEAFREFAHQVRENGALIVNFGAPNIAPILEGMTARLIDYGKYFDPTLKLRIPGVHNQLNAAAASAVSEFLGVKPLKLRNALEDFQGTWRRFEYKGEAKLPNGQSSGAVVYDDYGHHPSEIKATLLGARELYPHKKITLVFQPHTYSRVEALFDDFVRELGKADRVILVPIYAAREISKNGTSSVQLAGRIKSELNEVQYCNSLDEATELVRSSVSPNDMVLVMGAGTVTNIAHTLTA